MADTTVTKVKSEYSPHGKMGQKYLASGIHLSMRLWDEQPGDRAEASRSQQILRRPLFLSRPRAYDSARHRTLRAPVQGGEA